MKPSKIFSVTAALCSNCSNTGHLSKNCPHPITSFGVILFRVKSDWNQAESLVKGGITGMETTLSNIEYLLIQRKDTIGFIEIMRGKYNVNNTDYIKQQLICMTEEEHDKILTVDFDQLWENLWGPPLEHSHTYKYEKEQAKLKMEQLRPILKSLIDEIQGSKEPEWGFPKGRRDFFESDYACAMRELWEETNISQTDIIPIRNMEPIEENFFGTNGVQYCHKYFFAYAPPGVGEESLEKASENNKFIKREVRQICWFSYENAVEHIRPENPEKRQVLLRIHKILQKFCPFAVGLSNMKKSS
jgi:8-oxo-dGTP pyrophosphatase MutT (NUDIX family)